MSGAIYTHIALNDAFDRVAPSLIFSLLIICRLIILYQVNCKEKRELEIIKHLYEETYLNNESRESIIHDHQKNAKKKL
jgi:hypothetical protein